MVREVKSKEEFDAILAESGDKLVVIDYTASWCGPCRSIAPEFERLSQQYGDVATFIKVDVDKCKSVARAQGISAMPTFQFYKRGEKFFGFRGASVAKLESSVKAYSAGDAEPNPTPEDEGSMIGSTHEYESPITLMIALLPFVGSLIGMGTILTIYVLTKRNGHLPFGIATPPISLLGCKSPEHEAYQKGFTLTAICLLRCVNIWRKRFYPGLQMNNPTSSWIALVSGYVACIGVLGQGLITLEEDFVERIEAQRGLTLQGIYHQLLAGIFFLGAALHCYTTIYLCFYAGLGSGLYSKTGTITKLLCVITSFVSFPIAEALHPASTGNISNRQVAVGGVAQYLAVGSYILFFGSYSFDLLQHRTNNQEQEHKKD